MAMVKALVCKVMGHNFGDWETQPGNPCRQVKTCSRCGQEGDCLEEHDWQPAGYEMDYGGVVVRDNLPCPTAVRYAVFACTRCDAKRREEEYRISY